MPRIPTQSDFDRLTRGAVRQSNRLFSNFSKQAFDIDGLEERFQNMLADRHGRASFLGRQRAGDLSPYEEDDRRFGDQQVEAELEFINAFMQDIRDGKYTLENGYYDLPAMQRRAAMYSKKLRASANEAFVLASDEGDLFDWVLRAAEHCDDCIHYAAMSPYAQDDLPTYPGAGHSRCMVNCKCYLRRHSDGRQCFRATEDL